MSCCTRRQRPWCAWVCPGASASGPDGEFEGILDTKVTDPDLRDEDARTAGELVERLDDDGAQTRLIAIAPHGGGIEPHTDEQAERVRDRLGSQLASAWRCKGWGANGGAFARWHITSTDIDPASFPLLATVASRRFARAVAFHGFDDEAGVLIGGTAPDQVKERVRAAIARVLPTDLDVRVARPDERYAGDDPDNIVNRLSPCGGIQIEQGSTPRDDHAIAIADAVADVLRPRSPRDLEWVEDLMAQLWARVRSIADRRADDVAPRCRVDHPLGDAERHRRRRRLAQPRRYLHRHQAGGDRLVIGRSRLRPLDPRRRARRLEAPAALTSDGPRFATTACRSNARTDIGRSSPGGRVECADNTGERRTDASNGGRNGKGIIARPDCSAFLQSEALNFEAMGKFVTELGPELLVRDNGWHGINFGRFNILAWMSTASVRCGSTRREPRRGVTSGRGGRGRRLSLVGRCGRDFVDDARPQALVTDWPAADLERRLCRVRLDLAAQTVTDFADTGYTNTLDPRASFGPEKVVAEAAMLAYAASGVVGRSGFRRRVDDLAGRLVPYVRSRNQRWPTWRCSPDGRSSTPFPTCC